MEDQTKVILRNIFLGLSMKYGAVKVKASWKPSAEGNVTVNIETDYTHSDTQFQIENCASLKEARRVQNLPIDELIASSEFKNDDLYINFDWNSTVTFTFSFVHNHQANHEIIVDQGKIDWDSIEDTNANLFYVIATHPKVLENH